MFGYEEVNLSIAYPLIYFLIALVLFGLYSYYVYRYTIPQIEKYKKAMLVTLRVSALLILCVILFEPILTLITKQTLEPSNLVFIDNSRSIKIDDGTNRQIQIKQIVDELSRNISQDNLSFFEFGNSVREIDKDNLDSINFSDGSTNLQEIFDFVKNSDRNIASLTMITDGVITSGSNPYYNAVNIGIPVFAIGIGDTTQRKDVNLKKVLHNDFIYTQTPTSIIATVANKGFSGEQITAKLFEDNKFVSQQNLTLSNTGIQNISFDYNPEVVGEKKLSIELSSLNDEFTTINNKQIFYLNVLSNKIKVLLLASAPSPDLTFIQNSLSRDQNIEVRSIVQVSADKFLSKLSYDIVDSADVLFLVGFPSDKTPSELFNLVSTKIKENNTPFFITLSSGVNLIRLSSLGDELPFTFNQNIPGFREVQPYLLPEALTNPIVQSPDQNLQQVWNNLPPVLQLNTIFSSRIESKTIAQISVNNNIVNTPLIVSRNFSGKRSIAVLAKDIWKWKLQVAPKGIEVFDNFIVNSLRWLRANEEQKLVNIKTSRKNFSQGERIEFYGEVSDESLNPVSEANIKVEISSGTNKQDLDLQNVGPGLYEGAIVINDAGDYNYLAQAEIDEKILGKDQGSFNIGEIDIEMIDPVMNYPLLNLLANETGGEFYFPQNFNSLLEKIKLLKENSSKEKIITSEISLWSDTWMLVIAILLFALEWFIRKRNGML